MVIHLDLMVTLQQLPKEMPKLVKLKTNGDKLTFRHLFRVLHGLSTLDGFHFYVLAMKMLITLDMVGTGLKQSDFGELGLDMVSL